MKSNTHNISKDNSCAVLFAIFEYKIREATSSILTESGGGGVCARCESKISLSCGSTSERLAVKETR